MVHIWQACGEITLLLLKALFGILLPTWQLAEGTCHQAHFQNIQEHVVEFCFPTSMSQSHSNFKKHWLNIKNQIVYLFWVFIDNYKEVIDYYFSTVFYEFLIFI